MTAWYSSKLTLTALTSLVALLLIGNPAVLAQLERKPGCLLPADLGGCALPVIRFHYDPKLDTCRVFIYFGCDGNDNRFDSVEQCTRFCDAGPEPQNDPVPQNFPAPLGEAWPDVCALPADPGTCTDTNLIQYYYDTVTDSCRLFVYGGCGGNKNRFRTKLTCQVACGGTSQGPVTPAPAPAPGPSPTRRTTRRPFTRRTTRAPFTTRRRITTRTPPPPRPQPQCIQPRELLQSSTFNYRSSFFHIFPQLSLECGGVVRSWSFISRIDVVDELYLAVFRPSQPQPTPDQTVYTLVGMTPVLNYPVQRDTWVAYDVPTDRQFNVAAGDVLGLFYENWDFTNPISVVALADKYSLDYDRLKTGPELLAHVQQRGRQEVLSDMGFQGFIDMSSSVRVFRYPAMRVGIDTQARVLPTPTTRQPSNIDVGPQTRRTRTPVPTRPQTQPSTPAAGNSPACTAEFQTSQTCLDNALRQGVDSRVFKARWFFDITVRMCAMFWYVPDCYQSANLFNTESECRSTCFGFMVTTPPSV